MIKLKEIYVISSKHFLIINY